MHTGHVTTPFGRRPMTLALVKGQLEVAESRLIARVEKWKVFRDLCEARERFGLQDRALAVLDALLTFYPQTELDAEQGLVVFPSNGQL
jgi:replication initiation protein RepC